MNLLLAGWTLYLGLFLAGLAVYLFVSALIGNSKEAELLSWASGNEPVKSKSPLLQGSRKLMHQFTLKYALKVKDQKYRKRILKILLTSGLSRELNVDEFIGFQIFFGLFVPMVFAVLNFTLDFGFPWPMMGLIAAGGFYFPWAYATSEKRARESAVRVDLPFLADLLALSTAAGLDLISAVQKIVDKVQGSVLGDELGHVLKDIRLGSPRAEALKGLAYRLDMPEVTSFVAVLIDADATGAKISDVLKDQSAQIRLDRFVRAEKAGARASQAIMIPLVLCIFPAILIVVFGPVAIQFISGGN